MAQLQTHLGLRARVHEPGDARPGGFLLVGIQPRAARRDAGLGRDIGHLGEHQPGAADCAGAVMHDVPVAGHAVLGRIHAHRRHHNAVRQHHPAQLERLEHRGQRAIHRHLEPGGAHLAGEHLVGLVHELRGTQPQIVVGDGFGPGHHAERELHRVHAPEPPHLLEPYQRDVGGMLDLFHVLTPARLELLQGGGDVGPGLAEALEQPDRVFHGELGAGADGEMRGGLGVAQQHHVAHDGRAVADHRETSAIATGW